MVDFKLTGNKCWEGSLSVDNDFICVLGRVWCLQDLGICLVSGNAFKEAVVVRRILARAAWVVHWVPFLSQRVLGSVVGDAFPNHNTNSQYRNPTFYYIGTLDPLGYDSILD